MLPEKIKERTSRLLEVQIAERRSQLPKDIAVTRNHFGLNGTLQSSMYCLAVKEVCEREIEIRSVLAWQAIVRIMRTLAAEASTVEPSDVKIYIREKISVAHAEITDVLGQNLFNVMKIEQLPLNETRDHAIEKHEVEIDLYFDSIRLSAEAAKQFPDR